MTAKKTEPKIASKSSQKELLFKQEISPASWVHVDNANMAKQIYSESLKKFREQKNNPKNLPPDIVPYEIRMKGIENFVTDPGFKKFWERVGPYGILSCVGGLYIRHWENGKNGYRPIHPKISLAKRNQELIRSAAALNRFYKIVYSDASIAHCFETSFYEAAQKGNFLPNNPFNLGALLTSLYESLNDPTQGPCARIKTHANYPRNLREYKTVERVRFSCGISQHVKHIYGKNQHTLVSRILNTLRPDLGSFSEADIRHCINTHSKKWTG